MCRDAVGGVEHVSTDRLESAGGGEEARRHASEVVRAEAHYGAAILADIEGDFERMLAEGRSLLDMRVAGSSDWLAALQLVAAVNTIGNINRY